MAEPVDAKPHAMTVEAAIRSATIRLAAAGVQGAGRDARLLIAAALGATQEQLVLHPQRLLDLAATDRLAAMLERRALQEPVSRILGVREFYGRSFIVTPATLDPRPDSETLIDLVLAAVDQEGWRQRPLRIIDVGTGTGCLLLTLLAELPNATGVGTDVSAAALDVARRNAEALGLAGQIDLRIENALESGVDAFDILVSNPPYIPTSDIDGLDLDVRAYDPHLALDGGADGMAIYRRIAARLDKRVPDGWAAFEVGAGQADQVAGILAPATGGDPTRLMIARDLSGHQRCVAIRTHR
jgi:release factor glutamine methyltransferase